MTTNSKRKIYVILNETPDLSEIQVLQLLSQSEIDLASVVLVQASDTKLPMKPQDALIFVMFGDQSKNAQIESAVLDAARAGSHNIIGVWAPGQQEKSIHPTAIRFATAQIPWSPNSLKNELGSDCANAFLTPEGDVSDPNEIEPHECE